MGECRKKDIAMMMWKGKNKGFGKGKNPPQQQMRYRKCKGGNGNDWTWNDPWANSWKGKSGVHPVEEQYAWQSEDDITLFGLEVRTLINEEAQNKGETLQCENVQCGNAHTPVLDQKPRKCVKTVGSDVKKKSIEETL